MKPVQLQHRLSVISANANQSNIFGGICNFDLIFTFIFTLGFSYCLITAIILCQTNNDKINYIIWGLSWFLLSWV